ncbi:MAG: bifunctional phosphopantothenoylcysteine decarboxylase/phosphopantothenate--cysteine ligase CoaBC [Solirubrobacterales bacterium]|nr:bifunctional phosphopantothenoylcysteine decarboxylase/phosphopantothenate--cysteine ligase CoaBC [Solirubrobacterales bacterium]
MAETGGPRILLGVSGGIAAYKAVEFIRLGGAAGYRFRVLMTPAARSFIGPATFEGILGAPVLTSEFERDPMRGSFPGDPVPGHEPIGHLAVAEAADLFLVAPASANTLAKLATGQADSILTTAFLAFTGPRLVAPAMNERMYLADATVNNLETLRRRGVEVIEPGSGQLASKGEFGIGRLPEPTELLARVEAAMSHPERDLQGVRILVTAGGTREAIDPVRFIGNRSSGRMGFALAEASAARGADVTLIAANVNLETPAGVERIEVGSTAELDTACRERFPVNDVLLMAAAPADFTIAEPATEKLSRGQGTLELSLVGTEDILAGLAAARDHGQTVVGFAAQHGGDTVSAARDKLERKGVDMIVLNDVSDRRIGFDSDSNEVTLIEPDGETHLARAPKVRIANRILDRVSVLRGSD